MPQIGASVQPKLELFRNSGIYISVHPARTLLIIVLSLAWLPTVSHCKLEAVPGFEFLATCHGPAESAPAEQDADCDTDGCAPIESGQYLAGSKVPKAPKPALVPVVLMAALLPDNSLSRAGCDQPAFSPSPPELPRTWQFVCRTALPIRAPSAAS